MDYKNSLTLHLSILALGILQSSTLITGQQWITRFQPIEPTFELIPSSPLLPYDEPRGRMEYYTSTTLPPVTTTTTFAPTTQRVKSRRVPLKSTLVVNNQRKPYEPRNESINRKKPYELGNQHQSESMGHVHRKKVLYYKNIHHSVNSRQNPTSGSLGNSGQPRTTLIAYPIAYQRSAKISRPLEEEMIEVGRVSSNPPEQIAPVNAATVTVNSPKLVNRKRANARSASLLDVESSRLNPDRSLGNDMLYYPEPSSDEEANSTSGDKNGISSDPNTEFVIIK